MTESMIERVAMAIWEERRQRALRDGIDLEMWGDGTIPRANGIMEEASEAVRALREPTEEMVDYADSHTPADSDNLQCPDWYRHAIDSILSDTA
jgi:hypothetical protein